MTWLIINLIRFTSNDASGKNTKIVQAFFCRRNVINDICYVLENYKMDKLLLKALIEQLIMHLSGLNKTPTPGNTTVVLDSLSDMHAVFMGLTACIKALRSGNEMYSFSVEDRAVVFSSVHQLMGLKKADKDVENSCTSLILRVLHSEEGLQRQFFDESIPSCLQKS